MPSLTDLIVKDFDTRFKTLFEKGGNVQTEIDFREVGNKIEFVAFRNVFNLDDISNELGGHGGANNSGYMKYIGDGRAYYSLYDRDTTVIRTYGEAEINPNGDTHYTDYITGTRYSHQEWDRFIQWLREAGERFTTIKHKKEKQIQTITI